MQQRAFEESKILMLIRNKQETKEKIYLQGPIGIDKGEEFQYWTLGTDERFCSRYLNTE